MQPPDDVKPAIAPMGGLSVLLALLTTGLWGGNAVATRFAVDAIPPVAAAAIRFALASAIMLLRCLLEGRGLRLRRGQALPVLLLGFLLFVQISTFNVGVWLSNSSHGVMLVNTAMFWVLAIEHWITLTDRLTGRKVGGVMLASVGTALVLFTSKRRVESLPLDQPSLLGDLVLLGSAAILGGKIVYTRQSLKVVEPGKLILWHDVVGLVLFAAWSGMTETIDLGGFDRSVWLALLYQGVVVGGFCFAIQAQLLQKHSASQISVFAFATPLFGVAAAQLFRNDPLSPWLLVAIVCVTAGIVLVNWRPSLR
jgi:drug/metabolite transporter (DMT)-like permease